MRFCGAKITLSAGGSTIEIGPGGINISSGAVVTVQGVPAVEVESDSSDHHRRAATEPLRPVSRPDQLREVIGPRLGIHRPVDLTEEVARGGPRLRGPSCLAEALLNPTHVGEGATIAQQQSSGVGQRHRIVGSNLEQQVSP